MIKSIKKNQLNEESLIGGLGKVSDEFRMILDKFTANRKDYVSFFSQQI